MERKTEMKEGENMPRKNSKQYRKEIENGNVIVATVEFNDKRGIARYGYERQQERRQS